MISASAADITALELLVAMVGRALGRRSINTLQWF
jgi:hypothetical protein